MPLSGKEFKADLAAGKPKFGIFLNSVSPFLCSRFTHAGYDWLLIDAQHGPVDNGTLLNMIHAIHTGPARVMVRVAGTHDRSGIQQATDCGADGILIPYVNNAQELEKAVGVCYYPPNGTRSVFAYGSEANDHMIVAYQVETADCVKNIDEIMAVKGIDIAFVGPFDLCLSLGLYHNGKYVPPQMFFSPEFFGALDKVDAAARKNNVSMGIFLANTARVEEFLKRGYRFIALGSDVPLAMEFATQQMGDVAKATKKLNLTWQKAKL